MASQESSKVGRLFRTPGLSRGLFSRIVLLVSVHEVMSVLARVAVPAMSHKTDQVSQRRFPVRISGVWLTTACLLLVGILGYADYLTGYEQSFLLFYLLPIGLATWWGSLTLGIVFSALSVTAWIISDLEAGVPASASGSIGRSLRLPTANDGVWARNCMTGCAST
jgi:hypothetical protein